MRDEELINLLRVELRTGFLSVTDKLGETNARLDKVSDGLDRVSDRVDNVSDRVDNVSNRLDKMNARLDDVDGRLVTLTERVDRGFDGIGRYLMELEKHHDARLTRLERRERKDK